MLPNPITPKSIGREVTARTHYERPAYEPRLDELWDSTLCERAHDGGPLAAEARAELVRRGLAETTAAPASAVRAVVEGRERQIEHALGDVMRAAIAASRDGRALVYVHYQPHAANAVYVYAKRPSDTGKRLAPRLLDRTVYLTGPLSEDPANMLYELAGRIDALHPDMDPVSA